MIGGTGPRGGSGLPPPSPPEGPDWEGLPPPSPYVPVFSILSITFNKKLLIFKSIIYINIKRNIIETNKIISKIIYIIPKTPPWYPSAAPPFKFFFI